MGMDTLGPLLYGAGQLGTAVGNAAAPWGNALWQTGSAIGPLAQDAGAFSQAGNMLSRLGGQGGQMNVPIQIPKPFAQMQAPGMQQPDLGTAQPVGVPMAGTMQRPPMQPGMMPPQMTTPIGGMGMPPPGAHQPVNPGADPNSLIMLQLLKLMGQG